MTGYACTLRGAHPTSGAGTAVYVHGDHLGTARAFTDSGGDVVGQRFFNAWGGLEASTGSVSTRYGYVGAQGYQTDAATGLMHLGARYYDPTIGRFLQRDPIGIAGGFNAYAYTENAPTSASDPDGMKKQRFERKIDEMQLICPNYDLPGYNKVITQEKWGTFEYDDMSGARGAALLSGIGACIVGASSLVAPPMAGIAAWIGAGALAADTAADIQEEHNRRNAKLVESRWITVRCENVRRGVYVD